MPASPQKRKARRSKAGTPPPASSCRALVPVDSEPLRRRLWQSYQNALRKFAQGAAELQRFKGVEQERYRLWYEGELGAEIIALQKSRSAVEELTDWMEQIEAYAEYRNVSLGESLRVLQEAKEKGRLQEFWTEVVREIEKEEEARRQRDAGRQKKRERLEDFERIFDEAAAEFQELHGDDKAERDEGLEKSLKGLYHRLALRLHPDTNPHQNEEHRLLFQKVQEAYRDRDLEGLEEVWKRLEGKGEEVFSWKTAAIGEIIRRKKALDLRNRDLGTELKYAKAHPAWEFSKTLHNRTSLSRLKQKLRNALRKEQEQIDAIWVELNEQLQAVEKRSQSRAKKRPKVKPKH